VTRQQRRAAGRAAKASRQAAPRPWRRLAVAGGVVVALGAAFLIWGGSATAVREGAPTWSPDGSRIAFYAEQPGGKADLFVMNADGSGRRPLVQTAAGEGAPAFSPDGGQIAYDTDRDGNFEIYVMNADGTNTRRLTSHPGRDLAPAWSPDGQWIVFMSDRDARPEFDVFRMKADGSGVERLTSGATHWFPQYSPDGTKIAMHVWRDVHVMDAATRALTRLTTDPANGMYPTWSPDGKQIAFMSWRSGPTEIYTMNADGSEQRLLVRMRSGSALDPRWSPKGDRIAFVHVPEASVHDQQSGGEERKIYVVEVATGALTRLSR
jgi:Tol biopolymer transport system component